MVEILDGGIHSGDDFNPTGDSAGRGAWIPWVTGALLVIFFTLARLFPGYWTWPFNAVAYLSLWQGIFLLVALLAVLVLVTRYRARFLSWSPSSAVQWGIMLTVALVFIAAIAAGSVCFPNLEGDGGIDHDYKTWRWREVLVRKVVAPALGLDELPAASVTWRLLGVIYIAGATIFLATLCRDFWSRLWGLILCAVVPQVLSFTGHYDSYPDTFVCVSAFLALMYLAAVRPSPGFLLSAIILFFLSFRAHPYTVALLIYPVCWASIKFVRARSPRTWWIILMIPVAVVLAGLIIPSLVCPERAPFGWGRWFIAVAQRDSFIIALTCNMILHLGYLLPYMFSMVAILFSGPGKQALRENDATAAAFLGSGSLLLLIGVIEIFSPLTGWGIREFLSLAGTFGGLFFLPMLIMLVSRLRGWLYCFVVFSAFMTLPVLVIQRGPLSLVRFRDTLADDRGCYMMRMSPYLDAGQRLFHSPFHRRLDRSDALKLHRLGCEILEQGGEDSGFYRGFAPLNLYHAVLYRYGIGDHEKAMINLERLLRQWPRSSLLLSGERWDTSTMDSGSKDVIKPPVDNVRDHEYWQAQIIPEAEKIFTRLAAETGETLYEEMRWRLGEWESRRPLKFEEMIAACLVVSYHESPGSARPYKDMEEKGRKVLEEIGKVDLIEGE